MSEFFNAINAMTWPGAFALVGCAAALAYWLKGHPDAPDGVDEQDVRRIVREELAKEPKNG